MGEDVLYSGTVAAAMEGVTLGVPSVAISFAGPASDLETLESYREVLAGLVPGSSAWRISPPSTLLNINLPPMRSGRTEGGEGDVAGEPLLQASR